MDDDNKGLFDPPTPREGSPIPANLFAEYSEDERDDSEADLEVNSNFDIENMMGEMDDMAYMMGMDDGMEEIKPIAYILLYVDHDMEVKRENYHPHHAHYLDLSELERIYDECAEKSIDLYLAVDRGAEEELLGRIFEHSPRLSDGYTNSRVMFIKSDEAEDAIMKGSLGVFFFCRNKNEYLTRNFGKLIDYNKFVLHKKFDSYKALLDVLVNRRSCSHPYENDAFMHYYKILPSPADPTLDMLFNSFYQRYLHKKLQVSDLHLTLPPVPEAAPPVPEAAPSAESRKILKKQLSPIAAKVSATTTTDHFVTSDDGMKEEMPKEEAEAKADAEEEGKAAAAPTSERPIQIKREKAAIFRLPENKIHNVLYTAYIDINYMREEDKTIKVDLMVNHAQKFAIMQNCRNPSIDIVYIYHCDAEEDLMRDFMQNLTEEECKKIRFLENSYQDVFMVADAVKHANENHPSDIIYLIRCDCYIGDSSLLSKIMVSFTMDTSHKRAYSVSRSERTMSGYVFKDPRYVANYYSISQDLFIFESPLQIKEEAADAAETAAKFSELDLYEGHHELVFNKILEENGYRLYNDTETVKVLRVMKSNDMSQHSLDKREIVKPSSNKMCNTANYSYLPEGFALGLMSVDEMVEKYHITEDELYQLKRYIYLHFCR